jgi:large subunit ribosomal protein L29
MPSRITKAKQLREKTQAELEQHVVKLRRDSFDISFKHSTRQLEDTASMKKTRRELARTMSVLDELKRKQAAQPK